MNNTKKPFSFTEQEVIDLHTYYLATHNQVELMDKITSAVLQHYNLRTLDELTESSQTDKQLKYNITTTIKRYQLNIITKTKTKQVSVHHKCGDYVLDANGAKIPTSDGLDYRKYTMDVTEYKQQEVEVPYWDTKNCDSARKEVERLISNIVALPDYDTLREKYEANTDYTRACNIIRNLTKYYIFDDPELFVEHFALLISNAKAKALGYKPKYPILLSIFGGMGLGKSWLAEMIKDTHDKAFGCRSGVTSFARLLGQFNAMMLTRGFLAIDEAQGLDKAQADKLKNYITSREVDIERKGCDVKTYPNLVTFISTTNETIRDIMGLQQDRRITEFKLLRKEGEIPEEQIRAWLDELWLVMPVIHPHSEEIKNYLLETSESRLDKTMEDIVYDLFENYGSDIVRNNHLTTHKFKEAIKKMGGIAQARVRDWCEEKGIFRRNKAGQYYVSQTALDELKNAIRNDGAKTEQHFDIDEIFNIEAC